VDYILITIKDLVIPTLITPDMNGKNDYFIIKGIETFGKAALTVCDRRGAVLYENTDYDNTWSGFDYKGNPLPNDTYFFLLKPEIGKSIKGYIVIRR
jgi:gliding motility-associated-like protein